MFSSPQINIYTESVSRLVTFYMDLGFQETFRWPRDIQAKHVELRLEQFVIGIADVQSARDDHGLNPDLHGRPVEIVFFTNDLALDFARLTAAGAPSLSEPHDWLDGKLRIAWIADPDGNPIQLVKKQS